MLSEESSQLATPSKIIRPTRISESSPETFEGAAAPMHRSIQESQLPLTENKINTLLIKLKFSHT